MADRSALGAIGLMLGAVTLLVTMVGAMVVSNHMNGVMPVDVALSAKLEAGAR